MTRALLAITAAALVLAPSVAAQRRVAIVSSGNEQAIAAGKTILSRPFGAQLVDRLSVIGSYPAGRVTYHLVRGDAAGQCPSRFVVVATGTGAAPEASEPFGTCAGQARAAATRTGFVVTMPATAQGGPPVRFGWDSGKMRLLDAMPAAVVAEADGAPGYAARQAATCRTPTSADPGTQAAVVEEFTRDYPGDFRTQSTLNRTDIPADELRATVTGLACLARWPGAETVVPEAATPLFASKRHGEAAFRTIQVIARDPNSDANLRAAVRAFGAEMLYRVDRREPL
ncbi:hypothetical protein ASG29_02385 [Sphingomonas sp. Leaf412]|uniref:hypothetical protein n=1 Tax=Sphingomonas sp. Leaf412 TaxID=1736370 RepID=UPI0006F384A1|nr:hypothetical protein [Sphingomonas sp. Leaf412]KQT35002.1 hypothetical protein ASG29_02385 [Sphingomonas sp. Leaf412]